MTFLANENSAECFADKETRFDIDCMLDAGERVDVEMQVGDQKNMQRRTLFYWGRLFLREFERGAV